jgi:hypothetical protein
VKDVPIFKLNPGVLSQALTQTWVEPATLLDATSFPALSLDDNTRLLCLQGENLLKAARRFLRSSQEYL